MSYPNIIKLNVGGIVFQTRKSTLTRVASCFKVPIETNSPLEKDEAGCIFIDRDPKHFPLILSYLRYGVVDLPGDSKEIREILKEAISYQVDGLVKLCNDRAPLAPSVRFLECDDEYIRLTTNPKKPVLIVFYRYDTWNIAFRREDCVENAVQRWSERCDVYFKSLGTAEGTNWKIKFFGFAKDHSRECNPCDVTVIVHDFFVLGCKGF